MRMGIFSTVSAAIRSSSARPGIPASAASISARLGLVLGCGGTPVRVLKNRMSREYVRQEKAGADKMALERFTLGSLRKAVFDGDTENGSLMAGQAAGLLHEVRPVEEIFAAMVSEAKTCITGLYKETI